MPKYIYVKNIEDLALTIYTIGYKNEGESIVILIKENESVVFSVVIDSFEYEGLNYTMSVLDDNNVQNVDVLCWSHPDRDHTLGLDSIIKTYCHATNFVTPEGLRERLNELNDDCKEIFKLIDKTHQSRKEKHKHRVGVANEGEIGSVVTKIFTDDFTRQLPLNISSLSPLFNWIEYYKCNDGTNYSNNTYSIALLINIGNRKHFFTSDVENKTIQYMDLESTKDLFYLKTPHHTSKSSSLMVDYFLSKDYNIPIVTTTIYERHKLPDCEIVQKYKNICTKFYSTNFGTLQDKSWGCIEFKYNLFDSEILQNIDKGVALYGLAGMIK